MPGALMTLSNDDCNIRGEGLVPLGMKFGRAKVKAAGEIMYQSSNDSITARLMMAFDFFFAEKCFKIMANKLDEMPADSSFTVTSERYHRSMVQFLDKDSTTAADQVINDLTMSGSYRRNKKLKFPIIFNDVNLIWNTDSSAFRSIGGAISVQSIGNTQLNKYFTGYVELIHRRRGDGFAFYIQPDPYSWFFFKYTKGVMEARSSDQKFNDVLEEMKDKNRRLPIEGNNEEYIFQLSDEAAKNQFLSKFNR